MTDNIHGFIYAKDSDGIVTVTMDMTGPVNTMNEQYRDAMDAVVARLESEPDLKGMVLTSAKKTFFAGGDLHEMLATPKGEEGAQMQIIERIKSALRRLEKLPVPVVAAINGVALGGGFEICMACNHRVVADSPSVVVGFPEVTLGLLPGGGGIVRSIHLLGLEKVLPLLLEGTRMKPAQALELGFVDQLVDSPDELVTVAKKWIRDNPDAGVQPWDQKGHRIPGGDIWNPANNGLLSAGAAMLFKKTRGLLPAPEQIMSVASDTLAIDFDAALRVETRALCYLITHPVAKNIITSSFFQLNRINSGASRPEGYPPAKMEKVGILGAGMMGQGIAWSAASAGINVVLKDVSLEAALKGKAYSEKLLDKQLQKGLIDDDKKAAVLDLITATDDYADLAGCDLVIEAVFEQLDLKHSVTAEAEKELPAGALLASNTSSLPISLLAEGSSRPDKFIGMHFFSPVDRMPLVELICGAKTSDETLAKAFDFVRQIRKTPIVVNDSLGFFTTRVFATYLDEGQKLLTEGLDPVLIESLSKLVGMPVGPLAMQDEVSQELLRKMAITHRQMGVYCSKSDTETAFELCTMMCDEYQRGGRHHGGGYYEYQSDGSKSIWPKLYELYHKPELKLPNQDVKDRILFRQVIESLKCLQENVLRSVADGNIGSLLGIAAPTWTGGFLQVVNTYEYAGESGASAFVIRARELAGKYGDRFAPPANLLEKAESGAKFE